MAQASPYILLTGTANPKLAEDVAKKLKTKVYNPVTRFADSEVRIRIPVNLRRASVFIIQPTSPPNVDGYFIETLLMIDAARRASAHEITVVIPYFGYARQDRKDRPRVPISSSVIARCLEFAGANRIVTIDLHSDQQQGFVQIPWDNLYASYSLIPKINLLRLKNLIIAAPDKGGVVRATAYSKRVKNEGLTIVYKERDVDSANKSEALDLIGNVKDKSVLIIDDMIDAGGTLCNAVNLIAQRGAKEIWACAAHGLFSADALEKISKSPLKKVIITDTIKPRDEVLNNKKIEIISVAPLISEAIKRIISGASISEKLIL